MVAESREEENFTNNNGLQLNELKVANGEKAGESEALLVDSKKEEEKKLPPKASLFQLFRYTTCCDRAMLICGIFVAIATGLGFPLLSIIMGDITQNFIDASILANFDSDWPGFDARMDVFNADVKRNCMRYVYLGIAVFVFACIQAACFLLVCENLVNRLRRHFFKAIMRQNIGYFDENQSGELGTKLFDQIERVKEGTGDKLGMMIQLFAQFFGGLAVAFAYDWSLTLIMMSLSPIMIFCGAFISKIMSSAATEEANKYAIAGGIAEEVLTSMRTVISFNGQRYEAERYDKALKAGESIGVRKSLLVGAGLVVTFMTLFGSYALAFYVGTNYVHDGKLDGGTVMKVFFGVMFGSMAMGHASQMASSLGTAMGAAGALYEVIDRKPEIDAYSESGKKPNDIKGKISIKDLRFSYPTRPDIEVLKGLNFEAEPGQTVALVGSSGCGKSTIVQLILRYYDPASGNICIDGIPVDELNIEYLRNTVAVVSQEPVLFNTTIEENISYGREGVTNGEIMEALRKANAYDFVKEFPDGIKTLVGDRGTQLSGGQKQRIAIARALVRNPKILLLDEATSALDAESESIVQQALENASKGRTTLVIAHRLSTVKNADKIVAMKQGEVVEVGKHEELIKKKGLYFELVESQVFVDVDDEGLEKPDYERTDSARSGGRSVRRLSSHQERELRRLKSQTSGGLVKDDTDLLPDANKPEKELKRLKKELEEEGATKANLFRILKYARPEWHFLLVATVCAIMQGCVFPTFSLFFAQIIETFSLKGDKLLREGHFWALMFLVLAGFSAFNMFFQAAFYGIAAEKLTMRLRSKTFTNILRMNVAYFDSPLHSPGKLTTRLSSDAPTVKTAIDYRIGGLLNAVIGIVCGVCIGLYFCWQLAIVVIAIAPVMGLAHQQHMKRFMGKSKEEAKELENSGKVALEAIENIRTVQALTLQKRLHEKFCHHLEGPHKSLKQKAWIQIITYGFSSSMFFFVYAISFRWGIWLIVHQYVKNPINILRALFAIAFTAGNLGMIVSYFPEYFKATFAAGLIFKMLEEKSTIDGMTDKGKKPEINGAIDLLKVFFRYPERRDITVLEDLDLSVKPGETLALVGPSGCGKSTVISLLERFYDPLDGSVCMDGEDLREINPTYLRSHMALVSQEPILFDTSIKSNIIYGLPENSVKDEEIIAVAKKANIHEFISQLPAGYETRVGDKGTQLSGGQKQRIAIARALIRNPKVLLLDEATSALDVESEKLVQEALDKASEGRTCIVVAHRLATIVNASKIMVVKDGKIVEQGTHNELIQKKGAYWTLTQKQTFGKENPKE